eukprot:6974056-Prymnesium_polylepis.1
MSAKRISLASTLDTFVCNLTSGISFIDGTWSWGFAVSETGGYPPLAEHFPGCFVSRDLYPQGSLMPPDPPFPVGMNERGLPDHTWVEVLRISRIDDKRSIKESIDRSQIGQVWTGSGSRAAAASGGTRAAVS